ncbi:hypothetical protein [Pseudomonas baetica]|uniref:hypothetical protein n=1 Tax=Pseudomonas baetica TaxID=674054 RepID=UPI0021AB5CCD|nr:hypothetical protein [Pseudomonas baetica]
MSYGARVWGPDGALQLDENSFTMRVVLSTLVSVSGGQTYQQFSVPGITPANGVAIVLPVGTYSDTTTQYETEVINDAVRVYNYVRGYAGTYVSTAGTMRLLVIRFS